MQKVNSPYWIQYFISLILIITLFSCEEKKTAGLSAKEYSTVLDSVKTTLVNYYTEINRDGLTAEFKYLDHSTDFYWTPPGFSHPISYEEVEKGVLANAGRYSSVDNRWLTLRIDPLTRELCSYTGQIQSSGRDTSGNSATYNLVETGLMIKRADGWKLFRGQTTVVQ